MRNIPDVHANDREIPAGKVLIAEPRDIGPNDPLAIPVTIDKRRAFGGRREVRLVAIPAGWAVAGSMMRWDNGCYAYQFEIDGARHGRRFKTFDEAEAAFSDLKD